MAEQKAGFTTSHLTDSTFKDILAGIDKTATLVTWSKFNLETLFGIFAESEPSGPTHGRITGFCGFELKYTLPDSHAIYEKKVVLKSKTRGKEVCSYLTDIIPNLESSVVDAWKEYLIKFGLSTSEHKELEFIKMRDLDICSIMPDIYWSKMDEDQDVFVFAMEYFNPEMISHMDSLEDPSIWKEDHILLSLQGIAMLHAKYYNKTNEIPHNLRKHLHTCNKEYLMDMVPLWKKLLDINKSHCLNDLWSQEEFDMIYNILDKFEIISEILDSSPKTLIHNDYSLRNVCLRKGTKLGKHRLCVYDWELVCIDQPQHDIAECLFYYLPPDTNISVWHFYIQKYLYYLTKELENNGNLPVEKEPLQIDEFTKVFDMCVFKLIIDHYGAFVTTAYRKFKWPQSKVYIKTALNYIRSMLDKYSFLK